MTQTSQKTSGSSNERDFVRTAMAKPLLSPERELELATAWRDDEDEAALHELTSSYMRLVVAVAARFKAYGLPMSDLIQEGNVGLMQAAARFEPDRQVRFSTYANWWIRAAIQDYVLRNWSIVRTGTTTAQKALFFNLRRLRAKLDPNSGGQLSPDGRRTIADALKVRERDVDSMAARLSAADRSLNAVVAVDGDAEWIDLLADDRALPDEEVMERNDSAKKTEWISKALACLNEREQKIIRERRLKESGVTLASLGEQLGISKERVRQIEHQALAKLKTALIKDTPLADYDDQYSA